MKRTLATALASCALYVAIGSLAANAQNIPKPAPSASPNALTVSGQVRAYQFDRENADQFENRSATNFSAFVHADYKFAQTGFTLGASYLGAFPFGLNGHNAQFNKLSDNTLPGSTLSTFPETYIKYGSSRFNATVGNQFLNEKWLPASDTRLKPAAYQGIAVSYKVAKNLTVSADRVIRFEGRTASAFTRNTLLTSSVLGGGTPSVTASTSGALLANIKYASPFVTALAENYSFYDLANLQYGEVRGNLSLKSVAKPFVVVQYVGENQAGKSLLGVVHNHTYGIQVGANIAKTLLATAAYDGSPTDLSATKSGIFRTSGEPGAYEYGSIATPYSDGYVTDPLFTSSLTTGNIESKATRSYKFGLYYTSPDKRLGVYTTKTYFENVGFNKANTQYETDADVTYYFNAVRAGAYKGLSLRERFGVRDQPFVTTNPSFQYVRTQVQYAF